MNPKCLYVHKLDQSGHKGSFQEYQREAYAYAQIGKTSLDEFTEQMASYKSKERSEFPAPEIIYTKKFEFLRDYNERPKIEVTNKKPVAVVNEKVKVKEVKKVNKFGFALEKDSLNNSLIFIPEEIETLLNKSKSISFLLICIDQPRKKEGDQKEEEIIESCSFTRASELKPIKWVEEFIETLQHSPKEHTRKIETTRVKFAQGPFLPEDPIFLTKIQRDNFYSLNGTVTGYNVYTKR